MLKLTKSLVLASGSPRRQQLLREAGFEFEILKSYFEETLPPKIASIDAPEYLAKQKSEAIEFPDPNALIITADTLVILNNEILGKPETAQDAKNMLQGLSGKQHIVVTGVCLRTANSVESFSTTTIVEFKDLSSSEIDFYISNYKPFDKAGAYGIQEWIGMIGVKRIEGSYFNVMGLPIDELYGRLINYT